MQLNEHSNFDPEIKNILLRKGYKYLSQGVDQIVFIDKDDPNFVLKIFGFNPRRNTKNNPNHKMLFVWAKFCEQNSHNPYLPKFNGVKVFTFNGNLYLQYRQERLKTNTVYNTAVTQIIVQCVEANYSFNELINGVNGTKKLTRVWLRDDAKQSIQQMNSIQLNQLKQFYNTILQIVRIRKKHGYANDLHSGNIMMRADSTPVITDPWVVHG